MSRSPGGSVSIRVATEPGRNNPFTVKARRQGVLGPEIENLELFEPSSLRGVVSVRLLTGAPKNQVQPTVEGYGRGVAVPPRVVVL